MRYHPPFGSVDPDASYVDRNTPGATKGSAVPAGAVEDPQREIVAVIEAAGLEPSDELFQLAIAIQSGRLNFAEATGTENALAASLVPAPLSLAAIIGTPITIRTGPAANTNGMTLNLNTLGNRPITHRDGSAIAPGEVPPTSFLNVMFDGEKFVAYAVALPAVGLSFASQTEADAGEDDTKPITSLKSYRARQQERATLASAATADLSSRTSQDILITGSTTISSFGNGRSGLWRRMTFQGVLTLVRSANLILPNGGANIVTEAGDSCVALSLGGGVWAVLSYQRAKGYNPIGDRQNWQEFLGQRLTNTAYQNTTGRTIMIGIGTENQMPASFELSADGSQWGQVGFGVYRQMSSNVAGFSSQGPFPVPAGYYYRFTTNDVITRWVELR